MENIYEQQEKNGYKHPISPRLSTFFGYRLQLQLQLQVKLEWSGGVEVKIAKRGKKGKHYIPLHHYPYNSGSGIWLDPSSIIIFYIWVWV